MRTLLLTVALIDALFGSGAVSLLRDAAEGRADAGPQAALFYGAGHNVVSAAVGRFAR